MKIVISILLLLPMCHAASWYAATNGLDANPGTLASPTSLSNILSAGSPAAPGDQIWLRGGTYTGAFISSLVGTSNSPIVVRSYPGEWAKIDSAGQSALGSASVLQVNGSFTWYWGFEVMNSSTDRTNVRNEGFSLLSSPGCKAINLVVHDNGDGIGNWISATNAEITGCIIYNNGWQATTNSDRGHGHGIYSQNADGMKLIRDNIVFNQFGEGMQFYGSGHPVWHYDLERNTVFGSGLSATNSAGTQVGWLFGGDIDDITMRRNISQAPVGGYNVMLSWDAGTNGSAVIQSNLWITADNKFTYWTNLNVSSNTFVLYPSRGVHFPDSETNHNVTWDWNAYFTTTGDFIYLSESVTDPSWNAWTNQFGYDRNGTLTLSDPTGNTVFVFPNSYESRRANIVVCNWSTNDNVSVDLSGVLDTGNTYEIRNAQDYFASPVVTGTFSGSQVSLPMTNLTVVQPINGPIVTQPTGPTFNTFVLLGSDPAPYIRVVP